MPLFTSRRGVSLIEILVVVGVLGLLLALLFPAIQSSRESARLTTCKNNLKQQALAIHNFESAYHHLPSIYNGTFLKHPRTFMDEFNYHSWQVAILPFIDQAPLFARIDQTLPATVVSNLPHLQVEVPTYLCPSTSTPTINVPDIYEWNDGNIQTKSIGSAARSDYEVVSGARFHPAPPDTFQSGDVRGQRFGPWGEPRYGGLHNHSIDGLRVARWKDVADGLSYTMLIQELAGGVDIYENGELSHPYPGIPGKMNRSHAPTWGISTASHFMRAESVNDNNFSGPFAFHLGGANGAMCDGSVRFFSEQTSTEIVKALATRAGGEPVTW